MCYLSTVFVNNINEFFTWNSGDDIATDIWIIGWGFVGGEVTSSFKNITTSLKKMVINLELDIVWE